MDVKKCKKIKALKRQIKRLEALILDRDERFYELVARHNSLADHVDKHIDKKKKRLRDD